MRKRNRSRRPDEQAVNGVFFSGNIFNRAESNNVYGAVNQNGDIG